MQRYERFFTDDRFEEGLKDSLKKNIKTIASKFKSSEIDKLDKALADQIKVNKKISAKKDKTDADKKALKAGRAKSSQIRKQIDAYIKKSNAEHEKKRK